MGADIFIIKSQGDSAQKAFDTAVREYRYACGHGGYSGTIAEKHSYTEIELPAGADAVKEANRMLNQDDDRISSKWGPAGCFKLPDNRYLFFGLASS